jgi:hypothetical protein
MPIDYEAEYNNRARVPEHPQIFARWTREAEDYRAEAMKERRAELGLSYGSTSRQVIDFFFPKSDASRSTAAIGARLIPRCSARWHAGSMPMAWRWRSPVTISAPR